MQKFTSDETCKFAVDMVAEVSELKKKKAASDRAVLRILEENKTLEEMVKQLDDRQRC